MHFNEEDYAEYEQIVGKKIRDLNRQRNYMIESVKKDWNARKAHHYKVRDSNPQLRYNSCNAVTEPTMQSQMAGPSSAEF